LPNDEIRRFSYNCDKLTYEGLIELLSKSIPHYHPEMRINYQDIDNDKIIVTTELEFREMLAHLTQLQNGKLSLLKLWITDSTKPLFRDGTADVIRSNIDQPFQERVYQAVSRLFPENKILPYHIPSYLQNVLSVKTTGTAEAEVNFDVSNLFSAINTAALDLFDSTEQHALNKAKTLLESLQILQPRNPDVYYNLACIESLLKNFENSLEFLKAAFKHGYANIEHMCEDLDLMFLKSVLKSQNKWEEFVASISSEVKSADNPVEKNEPIIVPINEPINEPLPVPQKVEEPLPVTVEAVKSDHPKYAKQIDAIKEMGFDLAESTLEVILDHHKGQVEGALSELV